MTAPACTKHKWSDNLLLCVRCGAPNPEVREVKGDESYILHLLARIAKLEAEVKGLRGFKRSVDEALNSGDGSYRP